jgi:hypothetical protein
VGRTYNQQINTNEVSLAIERFLVGLYPTSFTPARIDISSLPAGFLDLGAVVEDTPTVRVTREKYQLDVGLPRVRQIDQVIAVGAEISFSLYTNSWWHAQFALGNVTTIATVTTIASGAVNTQYLGRSVNKYFTLLGVADFINGVQVIHEFPKVSPSGNFEDMFRPSDASKMPFTFQALGVVATIDGCTDLVVGKRHYINGDGVPCVV